MTDTPFEFPLLTWTVYLDYGGAPLVWQREGHVQGRGVGSLQLHAGDMAEYVPDPMGQEFDELGCIWESDNTMGKKIDWLTFHQEALRLTALLALWVAQFNIFVRYQPPYEDSRFDAHNSETWMTPGTVARLASGMPSIEDDALAWNSLLALYGMSSLEQLGMDPLPGESRDSPTPLVLSQGCAPP